jgi:predicted N-acetyltransferase YhbS
MTTLPLIAPETPADAAEVDALIAAAFGPGRFVKTVERLREGNHPLLDLSAVARQDGRVIGCSRLWPIHIGGRPAILLGPFAVDATSRSAGLGAAMIAWCCDRAAAAGHDLVLLVGDAPYFDRLGFVSAKDCELPGPVNRRRMLVKPLKPGAADGLSGHVTL